MGSGAFIGFKICSAARRCSAFSPAGLFTCGGLLTWTSNEFICPLSPIFASIFVTIAGASGDDDNSSSRDHTTLTWLPSHSFAIKTASSTTSSAPLCP